MLSRGMQALFAGLFLEAITADTLPSCCLIRQSYTLEEDEAIYQTISSDTSQLVVSNYDKACGRTWNLSKSSATAVFGPKNTPNNAYFATFAILRQKYLKGLK